MTNVVLIVLDVLAFSALFVFSIPILVIGEAKKRIRERGLSDWMLNHYLKDFKYRIGIYAALAVVLHVPWFYWRYFPSWWPIWSLAVAYFAYLGLWSFIKLRKETRQFRAQRLAHREKHYGIVSPRGNT